MSFALSQQKSDEILNVIEGKRSEIYDVKNLYGEILKIAKHLFFENDQPVLFQNKDGFCFTVDFKPFSVTNTMELNPQLLFLIMQQPKHKIHILTWD